MRRIILIALFLLASTALIASLVSCSARGGDTATPNTETLDTETPAPTNTPKPTEKPTESPTPTLTPTEEVAVLLGYENCDGCQLDEIRPGSTESYKVLRSVDGSVMGYFDGSTGEWVSTQGWAEAIGKAIGPTWENFRRIYRDPPGRKVSLRFVLDGSVSTEPLEIKDGQGSLIVTYLVSTRGFYLDGEGKLQLVVLPVVIRLPSGEDTLIMSPKMKVSELWDADRIKTTLDTDPKELLAGTPGRIIHTSLTDLFHLSAVQGEHMASKTARAVAMFNEIYQDEIDLFISSGDPGSGIIFPSSWLDPGGIYAEIAMKGVQLPGR